MKWLEDLFFLVAFVMAVGLVTFSVYDGNNNAYPTVSSDEVVAQATNNERELPATQKRTSSTLAAIQPGDAAPVR